MLVLDIGNTNIKAAVFRDDAIVWSASAPNAKALQPKLSELQNLTAVAASSVRPGENDNVRAVIRELFGLPVLFLTEELRPGVVVDIERPETVGADRLASAIAAYHHARGAVIVVDCGTAIAFDVVSESGVFLGGAIAPGLSTSLAALHEKTALLPAVQPADPPGGFGKDTVDAMLAGVVGGLPGLVDRVVENIRESLNTNFTVYATGGDSRWIAPRSRTVTKVMPTLTLEGIYLAWKNHVQTPASHD